jgi:glyoxylase-like metal-dependent hydrolase (beta-lactamase superfamily II)
MGGRLFQTLLAPGHADGQLLFYQPAEALLLSGDHVLMKITPNIGYWPTSEPDPLGRYLDSLAELRPLPVKLALPGHRTLIHHWDHRIGELIHHHVERLEKMTAPPGVNPVRRRWRSALPCFLSTATAPTSCALRWAKPWPISSIWPSGARLSASRIRLDGGIEQ